MTVKDKSLQTQRSRSCNPDMKAYIKRVQEGLEAECPQGPVFEVNPVKRAPCGARREGNMTVVVIDTNGLVNEIPLTECHLLPRPIRPRTVRIQPTRRTQLVKCPHCSRRMHPRQLLAHFQARHMHLVKPVRLTRDRAAKPAGVVAVRTCGVLGRELGRRLLVGAGHVLLRAPA